MSGAKLVLTLYPPHEAGGEPLSVVWPMDEVVYMDTQRVDPPGLSAMALRGLEGVVTTLRRKEFRKELFVREATRLGVLLAERMEDAEGWHGYNREGLAKAELRRRK